MLCVYALGCLKPANQFSRIEMPYYSRSTVSNSSRGPVGGDSWAELWINCLQTIEIRCVLQILCLLSGRCVDCLSEMETSRDKVSKKPVRLIVAACNGMGIGKDGHMPWNLPSEFQYFLDTITRVSRPGKMNMLIWGRKNWFSNPENMFPLANTLSVVLSKTLTTPPDCAHFLRSDFDSAVRLAAQPPLADLIETIWVIGGVQVYKEGLEHAWCDLVYLTDVMADFDCDVFFPEFDRGIFKLQESFAGVPSGIQEENGIKYKCQVFKRD